MPPVPVEESAAAATPAAEELTVVEPVVTELPPAVPAMESGEVQPEVPAAELAVRAGCASGGGSASSGGGDSGEAGERGAVRPGLSVRGGGADGYAGG